ncbi:sugar ABC transporter ATP-binding protein [Mediterraneibacter gnavus]|uniref:sugar ABC transporter ATP-binding protein n=1 Tax=Mediterraneibacter gnavus TaxID=33038 RepID=UPI00232B466A|nr:sugar ABC transporter ATP-binding protein [Mediterraneibacter gnavus]MDB8710060.1 sugar ABC transporter ATP-binding protein [Mediterraneibacter gnavus]MDB8713471.1 sugar ABC transporter ATP-binding protein [Mediterraneibacter gnavus]
MGEFALEMLDVTKTFSKVTALDHVNLRVKKGEIHALIGENGAGKSTLMKVLSGVYKADAGTIKINGEEVSIKNPRDAIDKGVAIIYQELSLVPELDAIKNVMLGQEKNTLQIINTKKENEFAKGYLDYVSRGTISDYKTPVKHLSVAQQQMIDIAKALSYDSKIIIMDEPSDSLTNSEIETLFEIVRKLKEDGITVIYISHRLEELFALCDRVTVLRDGKYITDADIADIDKNWLISKMIGRDLKDTFPPRHRSQSSENVLEVEGLTGERFRNVSFKLRKGEILGFGGLVGAGRTEVLRAIFGADKYHQGTIKINGEEVNINHPNKAVKYGIGFATEDRKTQGLFLNQGIQENILAAALDKVSVSGFMQRKKEQTLAGKYFEELKVVSPDMEKLCKYLSGGNQQKVVLAKWLASECKILFLDEPTRGIDVGAKYEIYLLMDKLVQEGVSIVMISSEMPELMGVSDRVLVMHEGMITGELMTSDFSEENILKLASGESVA